MPGTTKKEYKLPSGETREEISNVIVKYIDSIIELDNDSRLIVKNTTTEKDNITLINADTTLTLAQQGLVISDSSSTVTVNLPTAVNNDNKVYSITNNNTGVVVIDGFGSETIQGDTTVNLYEDENLDLISYQGNWYIKG